MMNVEHTGLIPDALLHDVKQRDRVLFLGADLSLGYAGAPPSRLELAQALARQYDLPPDKSWPETATAYLSRFPNDRHGLIAFVREHCSGPQVHPGPLHRAIAEVGFRAIVTAWYDELLEEALRDAGYRVNRVVRDCQIPYAVEGEHEAIVIKLYGCLSDNKSLVLDMWDHERLMETLSRKLELATAFCAIRPPLFVGFNLLDRMPIRLYVRASQNMTQNMKRAYAVWPHDLQAVQGTWYGQNVDFRQADATAFLEALAAQLPSAAVVREIQIRVHRPPYMFLDYYTAQDADIFCGRDTETQIVTRLALSHRLLTLFGPSGAGKTSLLLAGVTPQLAAWEYQHVYVRALEDPLSALRRKIAARAGTQDDGAGTLRTFLTATLAEGDRLVVVLDQFEELFIRVGSRARRAFFVQLAEAL
ncbi:MAG: SIR2 family protein, partial [Chloroflexota bacterium]|nr:SIR2 family protein [Chloroflexota bacterium]